jgi:hypothetical protein
LRDYIDSSLRKCIMGMNYNSVIDKR